jgi:hypothetical protein
MVPVPEKECCRHLPPRRQPIGFEHFLLPAPIPEQNGCGSVQSRNAHPGEKSGSTIHCQLHAAWAITSIFHNQSGNMHFN